MHPRAVDTDVDAAPKGAADTEADSGTSARPWENKSTLSAHSPLGARFFIAPSFSRVLLKAVTGPPSVDGPGPSGLRLCRSLAVPRGDC